MTKLIALIVLSLSVFGQRVGGGTGRVPIPASGGGGGGPIAAGRVAFGDGTSTAATDALFQWDNTNKRLQVGPFPTGWSGYEPYITTTIAKEWGTTYGSYQDLYQLKVVSTYGDSMTGQTGADLYPFSVDAAITGNANLLTDGDGLVGANFTARASSTASAAYVIGSSYSAQALNSSVVSALTALSTQITTTGSAAVSNAHGLYLGFSVGGTITNLYGIKLEAAGGATNNWNIYSTAGTGTQARNYLGGNTGIGPGSDAPTNTLTVKDVAGSTSILFDIGGGQTNTSTLLTLGGVVRFNGQNTTGAGSASLGSNSPATTNTAPYTWIRAVSSDGSTVYIPAFK